MYLLNIDKLGMLCYVYMYYYVVRVKIPLFRELCHVCNNAFNKYLVNKLRVINEIRYRKHEIDSQNRNFLRKI